MESEVFADKVSLTPYTPDKVSLTPSHPHTLTPSHPTLLYLEA